MYNVILGLHIFVSILLIIVVLLQNSKGSDLGSALGGGTGEMFGPRAPANIMNRITTVIAATFLILSLTLAVISSNSSKSLLRDARTLPTTTSEELMPIIPTIPDAGAKTGGASLGHDESIHLDEKK